MGAIPKYYEDNLKIYDERMREKQEKEQEALQQSCTTQKKCDSKFKSPTDKKHGKYRVYGNRNEIHLYIEDLLTKESIAYLKGNQWKWSVALKCWKNRLTEQNIIFASKFLYGKNYGRYVAEHSAEDLEV